MHLQINKKELLKIIRKTSILKSVSIKILAKKGISESDNLCVFESKNKTFFISIKVKVSIEEEGCFTFNTDEFFQDKIKELPGDDIDIYDDNGFLFFEGEDILSFETIDNINDLILGDEILIAKNILFKGISNNVKNVLPFISNNKNLKFLSNPIINLYNKFSFMSFDGYLLTEEYIADVKLGKFYITNKSNFMMLKDIYSTGKNNGDIFVVNNEDKTLLYFKDDSISCLMEIEELTEINLMKLNGTTIHVVQNIDISKFYFELEKKKNENSKLSCFSINKDGIYIDKNGIYYSNTYFLYSIFKQIKSSKINLYMNNNGLVKIEQNNMSFIFKPAKNKKEDKNNV